jgi:hypothetical protein
MGSCNTKQKVVALQSHTLSQNEDKSTDPEIEVENLTLTHLSSLHASSPPLRKIHRSPSSFPETQDTEENTDKYERLRKKKSNIKGNGVIILQ